MITYDHKVSLARHCGLNLTDNRVDVLQGRECFRTVRSMQMLLMIHIDQVDKQEVWVAFIHDEDSHLSAYVVTLATGCQYSIRLFEVRR
jgi:hypothetical protein